MLVVSNKDNDDDNTQFCFPLKASGQRDATDILAMLKAFYATAVDYHEHALQPLGMFQIPYDPILLSTVNNDGTKERLPFAPGLVIVRRWGFSLLRPLIPLERMLWNPRLNWSPEMESSMFLSDTIVFFNVVFPKVL